MSIAVFRSPLYSPLQGTQWQSSWMVRPNPASKPTPPPVTKNIYYKPLHITTGHMGFLGTY